MDSFDPTVIGLPDDRMRKPQPSPTGECKCHPYRVTWHLAGGLYVYIVNVAHACLPGSAWTDANLAELAELIGSLVEACKSKPQE